jgi:heat shock protein HslJ
MTAAQVWAAVVVVGLLLGLGGCGDSEDTASESPSSSGGEVSQSELDGRTYEATSVEGHELVVGTTLTVAFEGDTLAVQAGCNTMAGAYALDGGTLQWSGDPGSTLMGCSEELAAQDQWLTELFTTGVSASLTESAATLASGDVTIELVRDDAEG